MQAIPPVMAIDLWHIFPLREEVISIYQTGVSRFFSPFSNLRVLPEPTDRECRKAHTLCARIDNFKNVRMIFKTTIKKTKTTSQMLSGLCLQKIKPMVNTVSWVYSNSLKLTLSNRLLPSEGLWTTKSQ